MLLMMARPFPPAAFGILLLTATSYRSRAYIQPSSFDLEEALNRQNRLLHSDVDLVQARLRLLNQPEQPISCSRSEIIGDEVIALESMIRDTSLLSHLEAFQGIADRNGGTRASGTLGYDESAEYVIEQLQSVGYAVTAQEFTFPFFRELSLPSLEIVISNTVPLGLIEPVNNSTTFFTAKLSGAGSVESILIPVIITRVNPDDSTPPPSASGCELEHFVDVQGKIALIQRGTCSLTLKVENAATSGAVGVILFSQGREGSAPASMISMDVPVSIPVFHVTSELGVALLDSALASTTVVRMEVNVESEYRTTTNILADTNSGNSSNTIVVGAHLDSVVISPGLNDNGSGSAAILEVALRLAEWDCSPYTPLNNRVRFAWWGAEELGLVGSAVYVNTASPETIEGIKMYINLDMVGSPNFVRYVLDGDNSLGSTATAFGGPGSPEARMEQVLSEHFRTNNLPYEQLAFRDGRSDHFSFWNVSIPVSLVHTGAFQIKTSDQSAVYGGDFDVKMDLCYHEECDTINNVNLTVFGEMTRAVAHAVGYYSMKQGDLFDRSTGGGTSAAVGGVVVGWGTACVVASSAWLMLAVLLAF